ncbi:MULTISPECIES: hypothetical protein [Microvirga]|uniref:hypothetical protein n=1 Tax=Microvirga TaxID=186650 RepID=UPI001CFF9A29|nr:hypothetical protein [Microvirga lenta]MCB5175622.1 hypothetical protein [Microvirga lenta]
MPSLGFEGWNSFGPSGDDAAGHEPETADEFAQQVIHAICHASVTASVGRRTYERCLRALAFGSTTRLGFRHPGKADAIDLVWRERNRLYDEYLASPDKLAYLATLPWVGPVTKHSLARRLGLLAEHEHRAVA